ncbi:hypothetical protein D3C84_1212570 [compost metagenome]
MPHGLPAADSSPVPTPAQPATRQPDRYGSNYRWPAAHPAASYPDAQVPLLRGRAEIFALVVRATNGTSR